MAPEVGLGLLTSEFQENFAVFLMKCNDFWQLQGLAILMKATAKLLDLLHCY